MKLYTSRSCCIIFFPSEGVHNLDRSPPSIINNLVFCCEHRSLKKQVLMWQNYLTKMITLKPYLDSKGCGSTLLLVWGRILPLHHSPKRRSVYGVYNASMFIYAFFVCIDFTFLGVIYSKGKPVVVLIVGYTLGIRYWSLKIWYTIMVVWIFEICIPNIFIESL